MAELDKLFDEVRPAGKAAPPGALARADGFYSEGRYAESIPLYEEALKTLPKTAAVYPRAVESLLFSLTVSREAARCVAVARESLPNVRRIPAAAAVAGAGLDCASSLAPGAPGRAADVADFQSESRAILSDPKLTLAADDRSGLYGSLFDARRDAEATRRAPTRWPSTGSRTSRPRRARRRRPSSSRPSTRTGSAPSRRRERSRRRSRCSRSPSTTSRRTTTRPRAWPTST